MLKAPRDEKRTRLQALTEERIDALRESGRMYSNEVFRDTKALDKFVGAAIDESNRKLGKGLHLDRLR